MKAHWAPIFFAAGLGAGWLIFVGGVRESADAAGNKSGAPVIRKRETRPVTSSHEAKLRTLAKEFPKLSIEDKEAFKKALAPGDRAALIEALLTQVGPDGIPMQTKFDISEIIKTWGGEDFDGAWAWCQGIDGDANRKFVASKLLNILADKDSNRAFALHLEMAAEDPDFNSSVPLDILRKAASKDAASFLDLLCKLPFNNNSNYSAMNFAADFDFQQAAEGFAALQKNHEGKSPPAFASNFLSTWAARDADAAYAWFSKNGTGPYENFGSLLDGIEKQGVPGASSAWAAGKLNEIGPERDTMIRSLFQYGSDRMPTVINSIAQAMPDAASRDRFLGDVVKTTQLNDPTVEFGYALTQMSSPEVRLETLRHLGTNGRLRAVRIPEEQLQQWGLTRQHVEQAQAPGN